MFDDDNYDDIGTETQRIVIPYEPRAWQADIHRQLRRFNVIVCHRGAGKSVLCMNELIRKALSGPPAAEYVYLLPLRNQAKRNVWVPFKRFLDPIPGIHYDNAALEATLPNDSKIMVLGADNPESLRGLHLHGIVLDEFSDMHANTWRAVRPMLTNHNGWAIWIGTPKGHNEFYRKYMQSLEPNRPSWFGAFMPYWATNALSAEEVEQMKTEMLPEEFAQELECFPPGSLVATHNDVVPIERLQVGDLVVTHKGRLQPVTKTMQKQYDGDLVVINAWGGKPLRLTPDHTVRAGDPVSQRYSWTAAKDVKAGDWLIIPKKASGLPVIPAALAELIAWYVAEGSVANNVLTFSLGKHEPGFIQRVQECLAALGRKSVLKPQGSVVCVIVCDAALCDFMAANCGRKAHFKRLPLSLLAGHERLVWDTLIDGDGCVTPAPYGYKPRPVYSYTTVSEVLVQQVQLLAASIHLGGTYTVRPGGPCVIEGRQVVSSTSYLLQAREARYYEDKRADTKIRCAKNGIMGRVRAVSTEPYSGLVHNISVAQDESYTVNNWAVHNCSFSAALIGSYYGKQLSEQRDRGYISPNPLYRTDLEVYTAWDLGIRDKMAVWFFQLIDNEIAFIDFEQHSNFGFKEWKALLDLKKQHYWYQYAIHIAPFDIKNREIGSGISRLESAEQVGIRFEICPKQDIMDGIEIVRRHLPRCRFHSIMCEEGLEALMMYRAKVDRMGNGLGPQHDESSHASDSLRYAMTYVTQVLNKPAILRLPFLRNR